MIRELRSEAAKSLLAYFFLHENEELYVNELVRKLKIDKRNLIKKLKEYETDGLFKCSTRGNLRLYSLNKRFPLYKEYKETTLKTVGVLQYLKDALIKVKGVEKAFVFGSYASGRMDELSDIDVMIIGSHDTIEVQKSVAMIQKKLEREINVINLSREEFDRKKNDPFINKILKEKRVDIL